MIALILTFFCVALFSAAVYVLCGMYPSEPQKPKIIKPTEALKEFKRKQEREWRIAIEYTNYHLTEDFKDSKDIEIPFLCEDFSEDVILKVKQALNDSGWIASYRVAEDGKMAYLAVSLREPSFPSEIRKQRICHE